MSAEVSRAQQWLNDTYGGHPKYDIIKVTGYPGTVTSKALVKAMQIEFGASDNCITGFFGNKTDALCNKSENMLSIGSTGNAVKILQYGLYSKGYNPKSEDGVFDKNTRDAMVKIQKDAGLSDSQIREKTNGMVMKAVLGVDEYKTVGLGDPQIRQIQQELNRTYLKYTGLCPCDGIYSRGTNKALVYAIQAEEHMSTSVANANFGPSTRRCCPTIPYSQGEKDYKGNKYSSASISRFTKLVQFSLYCIGHSKNSSNGSKYDPMIYDGNFNTLTKEAIHKFQKDVALPVRDKVNLDEWMGMLVSTGNPSRLTKACDCATRLTTEALTQLRFHKYKYIGRYLTGSYISKGKRIDKNLLRSEMQDIFDAEANLFVIYQDARDYYINNPHENNIKNYFTSEQGRQDAEKAFSVAKSLGVPRTEIIYFAVDYDFMESQVKSRIIPYFKAINKYKKDNNINYRIGIYGSRNTCTIVKNAGYSVSSFVSDMSTGYSGNLGYPLPDDWAFDQIAEYGASTNINVDRDKDVFSGKYNGFDHFEKAHDDDWDSIGGGGRAYVLVKGPKNEYPYDNSKIPVYWAKLKDSSRKFKVKYTMHSNIQVGAFFTMKFNNNVNSNDKIRYVYFRDDTGNVNAGYIDVSMMKLYPDSDSNKFVYNYFGATNVAYSNNGQNLELRYFTAPCDGKTVFVLKETVSCIGTDENPKELFPGTKVEIEAQTSVGYTHGNYIKCISVKKPDSDHWEYIFKDKTPAYIDLNFKYGDMPDKRAIVNEY